MQNSQGMSASTTSLVTQLFIMGLLSNLMKPFTCGFSCEVLLEGFSCGVGLLTHPFFCEGGETEGLVWRVCGGDDGVLGGVCGRASCGCGGAGARYLLGFLMKTGSAWSGAGVGCGVGEICLTCVVLASCGEGVSESELCEAGSCVAERLVVTG